MEQDLQYSENERVEVYDIGLKRWYKATTVYLVKYDLEAWECDLDNGNRGDFDIDHMRKVSR